MDTRNASPAEPVEWLFRRFAVHYGAARMSAHWGSADQAQEALAYWRRKLAGLNEAQFRHAVEHLPSNPPNPDEFLAIARRAPVPPSRRLPSSVLDDATLARRREYLRAQAERLGRKWSGAEGAD